MESLDRDEEAEEKYKMAMELDPSHATILNNYGYLLNKLERYDEAIEKYKEAIAIEPNYTLCYTRLEAILQEIKTSQPKLYNKEKQNLKKLLQENYELSELQGDKNFMELYNKFLSSNK